MPDKTALCWGDDSKGQSSDTPELTTFRALALGVSYTCGVRDADDEIECWGELPFDEAPPAGIAFFTIASGGYHSCALTTLDGAAHCWGLIPGGQSLPPGGQGSGMYVAISAGVSFTCAIRVADFRPECWGRIKGTPVDVEMSQIASGEKHACGLRKSDSVAVCWVKSTEPPNGADGQALPPLGANGTGIPLHTIAAGGRHTCGVVDSDRSLVCWGDNSDGQARRIQMPRQPRARRNAARCALSAPRALGGGE